MGKLAGKFALVTGASRGIGAAIAKRLAAEGAGVIVNYHKNAQAASLVVEAIRAGGGWAEAMQADAGHVAGIQALVERAAAAAVAAGGRLDILVNNAGICEPNPLEALDEAQFDQQFATNVKSVLFGAKAAAAAFGDKGGVIVNISSVNGKLPAAGASVYSATKAAVDSITLALAGELGSRGIRVVAVAPGLTTSDMVEAFYTPEAKAGVVKLTALGRLGACDDIAKVVAFVASDEAGWITGEVITASGGLRF